MEEISPIYEDVDIREWADQIRINKICELYDMIEEYKKMIETDAKKHYSPTHYKYAVRRQIKDLQNKINILKRK